MALFAVPTDLPQEIALATPPPIMDRPQSELDSCVRNNAPSEYPSLPLYDALPPVAGMPHGCTWGLWDALRLSPGPLDQLGTLNLLTPSVVRSARNEIQLGISVAVNWRMDRCAPAHSGRAKPCHRIFTLESAGGAWTGHDDEVSFNTQGGSQWDGFRHWAHQPSRTYYNGVRHEEITDPAAPLRNGIDGECPSRLR